MHIFTRSQKVYLEKTHAHLHAQLNSWFVKQGFHVLYYYKDVGFVCHIISARCLIKTFYFTFPVFGLNANVFAAKILAAHRD